MSSSKYIKRIVVATHLGTGLYADECCSVGPCTREPDHGGPHSDILGEKRFHLIDGKAGEIDLPASFAAYAAENEAAISKIVDQWFQEGSFVAEETFGNGSVLPTSPYAPGSLANHWWTVGFSYAARLLRALTAERDVRDYAERFGDLESAP